MGNEDVNAERYPRVTHERRCPCMARIQSPTL